MYLVAEKNSALGASSTDEIRVQIKFKENTKYGIFTDALYFTQAEFDALTIDDLKVKKKEHTDKWVYFVETESKKESPPPTEEELLAQQAELQAQLDAINAQLNP